MLRAQEQLKMAGCPVCHSTNIQFKRENSGEIFGQSSKRVVHTTVGFCKDCGYTWYPRQETQDQQGQPSAPQQAPYQPTPNQQTSYQPVRNSVPAKKEICLYG
jgi:hypothetical protein